MLVRTNDVSKEIKNSYARTSFTHVISVFAKTRYNRTTIDFGSKIAIHTKNSQTSSSRDFSEKSKIHAPWSSVRNPKLVLTLKSDSDNENVSLTIRNRYVANLAVL